MDVSTIADHIEIRRRYTRSVDLVRDFQDPQSIDGYIVTHAVQDAIERIFAGLSSESRQRAFRVVGPYGVGKSAFGVFLARTILEKGQGPSTTLLAQSTGKIHGALHWNPVAVNGHRTSLTQEIAKVALSVQNELDCGQRTVNEEVDMSKGWNTDVPSVIELLDSTCSRLRRQTGNGLLLLVDEMGRFLEHASSHFSGEDPSIFQALAEYASGGNRGDFAIIAFLNHRFEDHVLGQEKWMEVEWAKSSERYEEIQFSTSTEQSIFLLSAALEPKESHSEEIQDISLKLYQTAVKNRLFIPFTDDLERITTNLYPLHPASVVTLSYAIQKFGQYERSLFSFLLSMEPFGFRRFVHTTAYHEDNWYLIPSIFDYFSSTRQWVTSSSQSRRWSLASEALVCADDLPQSCIDVLKTIALISLIEPIPGINANAKVIAWCLFESEASVETILKVLTDRNLIYFRPFREDYSLWCRSSVDLSKELDQARINVPKMDTLSNEVMSFNRARSIVAHRHYVDTGTLRSFDVVIWDEYTPLTSARDGMIVIVPIYPIQDSIAGVKGPVDCYRKNPKVVITTASITQRDLDWAYELSLWKWIESNCAELKVDELARREVEDQIAVANSALRNIVLLLPNKEDAHTRSWWYLGKPIQEPNKGVSSLISDLCDKLYCESPTIINELINRDRLTAQVAGARMRLLDRMLLHENEKELGILGTPPERTIFLTLFGATQIHRQYTDGTFAFQPPSKKNKSKWRYVWNYINQLLNEDRPITIDEVVDKLAAPPYGMRREPALLTVVSILLASKDSVAVLEQNSYQPDLTTGHLMRLVKSPKRFSIRTLTGTAAHEGLIRKLASSLPTPNESLPTVSSILERLYEWYNTLPSYTLSTRTISKTAQSVRHALGRASDPRTLLFDELPKATGTRFETGGTDTSQFVRILVTSLKEMENAISALRTETLTLLLNAFREKSLNSLRSQLIKKFKRIYSRITEDRLYAFITRALDETLDDDRWLNSIASQVVGRRIDSWNDQSLYEFELEIFSIANSLSKWLILVQTHDEQKGNFHGVYVISTDGQVTTQSVNGNSISTQDSKKLNNIRKMLGNMSNRKELIAQLMVEFALDRNPHTVRLIDTLEEP